MISGPPRAHPAPATRSKSFPYPETMSSTSGLLLRSADNHNFQRNMLRGRGGTAQLREEVAGLRNRLQCKEDFCAQLIEENRQLLASVQMQRQEHDTEIDRVKREAAVVAQRLLDERLCLRAAIEELQEKLVAAGEALRTKQAQLLLAERRVGRGSEETKVLKRYTRSLQQQQAQTEDEARQLRSAYVDLKKSIQTFASGLAASKFMVDGDCDYDALVRTLSDGIRKLEVDVLSLDARLFKKGLLTDVSPEILLSSYNDRMVPSSEVEKAVKGRKLWQNKYDKLERELVQGKEALEKVKAELDQRNRRVMQLRVELSKRKSLSDDIQHLMQRNRELHATVEELQKERDKLRKWKANQAIRPPSRAAAAASPTTYPAAAAAAARAAAALASPSPHRRGAAVSRPGTGPAASPRRPSAAATGVSAADGSRRLSRSSPQGPPSPVHTRRVGSTIPLPSPVFTSKSFITLTPPSASAAALAADQKRRKSSRHSPVGASPPIVSGSGAAVQAPAALAPAAAAALASATAAAVASAAAAASSAAGAAPAERKGLAAGRTLSLSPFASPSSVFSPREDSTLLDGRGGATVRSPRARATAFHTAAPQYTSTAAIHASSPSSSVATAVAPPALSPPETVALTSPAAAAATSARIAAPPPALVAAAMPGGFTAASAVRTAAAAVTRTLSGVATTPRQATPATFVQQTKTVAVEEKRLREIVSGVAGEKTTSVALAAEAARVMTVAQYAMVTPTETTYTHPKEIAALATSSASPFSSPRRDGNFLGPTSIFSLSTSPAVAAADTGAVAALPSPTEALPLEDIGPVASTVSAAAAAATSPPPPPSLGASASPAATGTAALTAFSGPAVEQPSSVPSARARRGAGPQDLATSLSLSSAGPGSNSQSRSNSSGSETATATAITDRGSRTPTRAAGSSSRAAAPAGASTRAVAAADSGARAAAAPAEHGRAVPPDEKKKHPSYSGVVEVAEAPFCPPSAPPMRSTESSRLLPLGGAAAASPVSHVSAGGDAVEAAAAPAQGGDAASLPRAQEATAAAETAPAMSRAAAVAAFFRSPQSDTAAAAYSGKAGEPRRTTESDTRAERTTRRSSSKLVQGDAAAGAARIRGSSASLAGAGRTVVGPAAAAALRGASHRSWGGEGSLDWLAADSSSRAAAAETRSLGTARSCSTSSIAFFARDAQHQSANKYREGDGDAAAAARRRDRKERHHRKSTTKETTGNHQLEGKRGVVKPPEKNVEVLGGRSTSGSNKTTSRLFSIKGDAATGEDAWGETPKPRAAEKPVPPSWSRRNSSGGDGGSSSSSKYVTASEGEQAFSGEREELQTKGRTFQVRTVTPHDLTEALSARKPSGAATATAAEAAMSSPRRAAEGAAAGGGASNSGRRRRTLELAEDRNHAAGAAASGASPIELRGRDGEPVAMQEERHLQALLPASAAMQQLLRKVALTQAITGAAAGWGAEGRPLATRAAIRRRDQPTREDSFSGPSGAATLTLKGGQEEPQGGEKQVPRQQRPQRDPAFDGFSGSLACTLDDSSRRIAERREEKEEGGNETSVHARGAPASLTREAGYLPGSGRASQAFDGSGQLAAPMPAGHTGTAAEGAAGAPATHTEEAPATSDAGLEEVWQQRGQQPQQKDDPGVQQQQEVQQAKQQVRQAPLVRTKTLVPKARPLRMRGITQQHA